MKVILAEFIP